MDSPAEVEKALSSLLACQFPFPAVAAHELPVQPSGRSVCALCNGHLQAALPTHKKVRLPLGAWKMRRLLPAFCESSASACAGNGI